MGLFVPELEVVHTLPSIYRVNLDPSSFNAVLSTLTEEIIQDCSYSNLERALVDYITSVVDPVGWSAVWRSTRESTLLEKECDFIVEVQNVSLEKLEADVIIESVVLDDASPNIPKLRPECRIDGLVSVNLIELFVISEGDEESLYEKTAVAIEHVRLFLKNIVRPWDSEDDAVYTEYLIKPRLQLYFDMKGKILPQVMVSKVKSVLKEAGRIQQQLCSFYVDLNVSDSEAEINEEELMHSISLKKRLGKLQAKMEMLENPVIRSFVTKKYSPDHGLKKKPRAWTVTFVVAKQFTPNMIAELPLDSTSVLEFEHNPESAFKHSCAGDKIYIFPGVYQCDTLGWIEGNISVEGISDPSEIILEATGHSEVFMNCCAQRIDLRNIALRGRRGLLSTMVVHHGELLLHGCTVDANQADMGLLLLAGAQAVLSDSVVSNALEDGIQMRSLCSLELQSSKVVHSDRHGIQLDAENEFSNESYTNLVISSSSVSSNGGHALFLNNVPISEISLRPPIGDFSILKLFPWIKHEISDVVFENNGHCCVGVSSSCKIPAPEVQQKKTVKVSPDRESLNYSILSELLSEVNLSIEKQDFTLDETFP